MTATHETWQIEDGRSCPYYRSGGVCVTGCWIEPRCVTDESVEGWPLVEGPFECDCDEPDSHAEEAAAAAKFLAEIASRSKENA